MLVLEALDCILHFRTAIVSPHKGELTSGRLVRLVIGRSDPLGLSARPRPRRRFDPQ